MASHTNNAETKQGLLSEVKLLQTRCLDTYNIIVNSRYDATISPNNTEAKALTYLEGLRTVVSNFATPIPTNMNLITSQFMAEIKNRTMQVDELIAFVTGSVCDVEDEIVRLEGLIKTGKEALSKPPEKKQEVTVAQIKQVKDTFKSLKNALHALIQSMFPNTHDLVTDIFGQLMQENLNDGSSGYVPITQETFSIIEVLKDMNIVTTNPYNSMEVKLAL